MIVCFPIHELKPLASGRERLVSSFTEFRILNLIGAIRDGRAGGVIAETRKYSMSEVDASNNEVTEHSAAPQSTRGLVSAALVLPVSSGVLLFLVTSLPLAIGMSVVMVVATAALVAIDAHRLGCPSASQGRVSTT